MLRRLRWLTFALLILFLPFVLRWSLKPAAPQGLSSEQAGEVLRVARQQLLQLGGSSGSAGLDAVSVAGLTPALVALPLEGPLFLTLHGVGFTPLREPPTGQGGAPGTPLGEGLREALVQALTQTRQGLALPTERGTWSQAAPGLAGLRLQLELAGAPKPFPLPEPAWQVLFNPGVDGFYGEHAGQAYWQLPTRSVQRGWNLKAALKRIRAEVPTGLLSRFRTQAWLEATLPERAPLLLLRGQLPPEPVTAETLRASLRAAGHYLARMVKPDGRYCYTYLADQDRCDRDYNLLRHAGTTYSLYQLYEVVPEPELLAAAERAAAWLRLQERQVPGAVDQRYLLEGKLAKLGAVGLSLLAFVEREKRVQDGLDRDRMRAYARFIRLQQREDGHLFSWYAWDSRIPVPRSNSIYYPGEALLGLVRLQQLEPSAEVLETARRAADYLAFRRWRWGGIELYVPADAWLTQALAELHRLTPAEPLKEYVYKLVELTLQTQLMAEEGAPRELVGGPAAGFFVPAVTPAGSRSEGLAAACQLAREVGDRVQAQRLLEGLLRQAPFQLWHQLRPENSFFLPNPARAEGGFRASADQLDIRIDYVQHNVTGLVGLLKLLESSQGAQP